METKLEVRVANRHPKAVITVAGGAKTKTGEVINITVKVNFGSSGNRKTLKITELMFSGETPKRLQTWARRAAIQAGIDEAIIHSTFMAHMDKI